MKILSNILAISKIYLHIYMQNFKYICGSFCAPQSLSRIITTILVLPEYLGILWKCQLENIVWNTKYVIFKHE